MEAQIHKIELQVEKLDDVRELLELSDNNEDIDVILEKNFTGDLTTIELYVSLTANVILVLVPIIKTLIRQRKVSSIKIDQEKIEVTNVSQKMIEKILHYKMEQEASKMNTESKKHMGRSRLCFHHKKFSVKK